jgi:hypothetical protein
MNSQQIIRNYTISNTLGKPLTGITKDVIDFLNSEFIGLNSFCRSGRSVMNFYGKSRFNLILEYDSDEKACYISEDKIWKILRVNYTIVDSEVQKLLAWYIKLIPTEFNPPIDPSINFDHFLKGRIQM